jgi:hypothetical protein
MKLQIKWRWYIFKEVICLNEEYDQCGVHGKTSKKINKMIILSCECECLIK